MQGKPPFPDMSIWGYGLGLWRFSYQGHEVNHLTLLVHGPSLTVRWQILAHTGGIAGISTLVVFLPNDGLGVAVLANADEKDAANMAIVLKIVEDVLGLKRVDRRVTTDAT